MYIQLNSFNTANDDDSQGCTKVKFEVEVAFCLKKIVKFFCEKKKILRKMLLKCLNNV